VGDFNPVLTQPGDWDDATGAAELKLLGPFIACPRTITGGGESEASGDSIEGASSNSGTSPQPSAEPAPLPTLFMSFIDHTRSSVLCAGS